MKDNQLHTYEQSSNINASRAFLLLIVYLGIYICSKNILEIIYRLSFIVEIYKFQELIIPLWIRRFFSYSIITLSDLLAFFVIFRLTRRHFAGERLYKKDNFNVGWATGTFDQILLYAFYGILVFAFYFSLILMWLPTQDGIIT